MPDIPLVYAVTGIVASSLAVWIYFRPSVNRAGAAYDAILGEAEERDRSGAVSRVAQPGLVHRVAQVEEAVVEFRHVIGLFTEAMQRIDHVESRIGVLESASAEKAAIRRENAALFDMVAKRDSDVIDPQEEP